MKLSPWTVISGSLGLAFLVLLMSEEVLATVHIPEECFTDEKLVRELIYQPSDSKLSENREVELPVEGEQYTRVITNTQRAWEFTEGSPEVVVAVVDSGVDITHPDLAGNLWINQKERDGKTGVDDDGNGFVDDVHGWDFVRNKPVSIDRTGHGTHCAGNVAALRNGEGVVGVAPRVRVMPVRFMDNGSGTTADAIKALKYAAANGAHVISNSWSSSKRHRCMELAIRYAHAKGAIVVASANNQKRDIDRKPSYPASFPGVLAVGSSNDHDSRSKRSNWGKKSVFVFAPGEKSLSTDVGGYSVKTGTSMAAPQVAGALALAISLRPDVSRSRLQEVLCETSASALRTLSRCGRMDVGRFIEVLSKE